MMKMSTTETTRRPEDEGLPGFTAVAALVALVAAAFLAKRE